MAPGRPRNAVASLVLSSVGGSVIGAVAGGFVENDLALPWIFWIQLLVGGFCAVGASVLESRDLGLRFCSIGRRSDDGRVGEQSNVYGPNGFKGALFFKEVWTIWLSSVLHVPSRNRLFCGLSLLSGFGDALILAFLQPFQLVYKQQLGFRDHWCISGFQ